MFAEESSLKEDPTLQAISDAIRVIPDFPKPGIMFQDITTLLLDPKAFKHTVDGYRDMGISVIAGVETRGFMFGPPIALALGAKFVQKTARRVDNICVAKMELSMKQISLLTSFFGIAFFICAVIAENKKVICSVLQVIHQIIKDNIVFQENSCPVGLILVVMGSAMPDRPREVCMQLIFFSNCAGLSVVLYSCGLLATHVAAEFVLTWRLMLN